MSFLHAFLVVAAVWLLPSVSFGLWILADQWLERAAFGRDLARIRNLDETGGAS